MWLVWHVVTQGVRGVGRRTEFSHGCFFKDFESNLTVITNVHLQRSGIVDISMFYRFRYEYPSQMVGFLRLS